LGEPSLPPECEKPGTYDLAPCQGWVLSRAAQSNNWELWKDAVIY
jgi:hypothetical protein